ncbi:hypothetical protein R75461_07405 [Paraburkholderia nemoris]|uniref:hypothetical protein n=1 Tax=Paraburkholderia nemoris TaxID=2793076 RepID=UPI0019099452|nr:hypothetical protein [Paraburkholderia nemoris]MBK3786245.1 hypothetical protein [Paraburkholderia aspalathi]CAE6849547.1 hypothetical protein R75461_07405 [Paraburkholderia nemoris]
MPNPATLFSRVLADLFPGNSATSHQAASQPQQDPHPAARETPDASVPAARPNAPAHVVGQGAQNETVVTIGDVPHLFVDEGDHIVEFAPAFDNHAEQTEFGMKIVPDLIPHWFQIRIHRCALKEALAAAIRGTSTGASQPVASAPQAGSAALHVAANESDEPFDASGVKPSRERRSSGHDGASVRGRIVSWGEEKFPDRKRPGRFYDSFAIHVETATGERTLQGEGLKEAIAECRCSVGDVVSVRRLRKIQVPAIRADGSPKIVDGKQVMWDKWLWSITR